MIGDGGGGCQGALHVRAPSHGSARMAHARRRPSLRRGHSPHRLRVLRRMGGRRTSVHVLSPRSRWMGEATTKTRSRRGATPVGDRRHLRYARCSAVSREGTRLVVRTFIVTILHSAAPPSSRCSVRSISTSRRVSRRRCLQRHRPRISSALRERDGRVAHDLQLAGLGRCALLRCGCVRVVPSFGSRSACSSRCSVRRAVISKRPGLHPSTRTHRCSSKTEVRKSP